MMVTMTPNGPSISNVLLDGILGVDGKAVVQDNPS